MRRRFALLLVCGLLAFTLTACGEDDKDAGTNGGTTDNAVTDHTDDPLMGGSTDQSPDDSMSNTENDHSADTNGDGLLDDVENGLDDVENGLDDMKDDVEKSMGTDGASYDQMVRNGSVHDTDGVLTDGENATTPGAA